MFEKLNERAKRLTVWDIGFIKWSILFATIIIVKLFPQILKIDFWILIVLMVVCMAKPLYVFWVGK